MLDTSGLGGECLVALPPANDEASTDCTAKPLW